jgi:hypothetical protein
MKTSFWDKYAASIFSVDTEVEKEFFPKSALDLKPQTSILWWRVYSKRQYMTISLHGAIAQKIIKTYCTVENSNFITV